MSGQMCVFFGDTKTMTNLKLQNETRRKLRGSIPKREHNYFSWLFLN